MHVYKHTQVHMLPIFQGQPPERLSNTSSPPTFPLWSCSPVPYLDNGVASSRCLDSSSASLGLVVCPVVGLRLHLDPQLVGARLAGEWPLKGWERLDGQTGQGETTPAETLALYFSKPQSAPPPSTPLGLLPLQRLGVCY